RTPPLYTLSLHDALPIYGQLNEDADIDEQLQLVRGLPVGGPAADRHPSASRRLIGNAAASREPFKPSPPGEVFVPPASGLCGGRSEEHTSELQSRGHLVC